MADGHLPTAHTSLSYSHRVHAVDPGDVFFLPAGRVHAIGAGCFIAEIQQTSNITYRIFDYDRKGPDGKGRELHTELAKDAINYTVYPDYRTEYTRHKDMVTALAAVAGIVFSARNATATPQADYGFE